MLSQAIIIATAVVLVWLMAYFQAPFIIWTIVTILGFIALEWFEVLSLWSIASFTFATICILLILLDIGSIRRFVMSGPCYHLFRKFLPPISRTEQDAIDAGEVFWEASLFQGRPNWKTLMTYQKPTLTQEELDFLNNEVETLCNKLDDWTITHTTLDMSSEVWEYLKNKKFFGLVIPKEYGGLGFSPLASSTIVLKIASRSLTAAVTTMVPNSLGPGELLLAYGTEAQKKHYLPRLARGEEIPCFALTAPEAGSDASAIPDFGIVCRGNFEGKEIIGMRLTWDKRYITLAPRATVLGLAIKLYDPDGLLGDKPEIGMTLCLIPTSHPGVEIGMRHFPANQAFLNGPTRGKDVFVPLDWIIGEPKMAGKGWRMLVERLSAGRGISLPALSTASAKHSFRTAGAYAKIRRQFHTSIGRFEGVQEALARIGGITYILEATRLLTLTAVLQNIHPAIASAIAKYHMTELSREAMNDAMDIHGGRGIMLGPKNYIWRSYQSMPISITVEGANILTRNLIIFGQGMIRCHPYLRLEMAALSNKTAGTKEAIKAFDKAFCGHIKYAVSNFARTLFHSLTAGLFVPAISGIKGMPASKVCDLQKYVRQLGRMSIALSSVSELAILVYGGKLKRRERLSARLGDVLSNLYLASAVLKYYHDFGDKKTDLPYVEWSLQFCLYRCQVAFANFIHNFQVPWIQWFMRPLLRLLVFPYGLPYSPPSDDLEHRLANGMLTPGKMRDRMLTHCFVGNEENSEVALLEKTFELMVTAEPLLTKLSEAKKNGKFKHYPPLDFISEVTIARQDGLITEQEALLLKNFESARKEVIQVDEFTEEELISQNR